MAVAVAAARVWCQGPSFALPVGSVRSGLWAACRVVCRVCVAIRGNAPRVPCAVARVPTSVAEGARDKSCMRGAHAP